MPRGEASTSRPCFIEGPARLSDAGPVDRLHVREGSEKIERVGDPDTHMDLGGERRVGIGIHPIEATETTRVRFAWVVAN